MRKIFLVIAVLLLATPAWAAVNVTCTAVDPGNTYEVRVDYAVTDSNNIRAFGIRIDVNNGAAISNIDVNVADYYIFPGSIDINSSGDVNSWGSAVAEGGNGSAYMILEMGSLYAADDVDHPNKPPQSGTLCTFETSKECVVTLSNDTTRGGVVMEDGSDYASLSGDTVPYADCYPLCKADWADFDAAGRPPCWCYPRQCHGDADGAQQGGGKIPLVWVGTDDLDILAAAWKTDVGDPNFNACADFDHSSQGGGKIPIVRVGTDDLDIMALYWKDSSDGGPDPNADCQDCP